LARTQYLAEHITPRTMADKVGRVFGIRWRSHAKNLRNFGCPSDRRERLLRFVMRSLVFGKRRFFAVIRSQFHDKKLRCLLTAYWFI